MKKTAQGNKETEGTGLGAVLQPIWDQLDQLKEKPLSLEELQRPERPEIESMLKPSPTLEPRLER